MFVISFLESRFIWLRSIHFCKIVFKLKAINTIAVIS